VVELVEHQASWAAEYGREARRLRGALGDEIDALEHIGSTAVPGLLAKPVIDLAARASTGCTSSAAAAALNGLGYEQHRSGPQNHDVFVRVTDGRRTHILHVFTAEQWDSCAQRLLRDVLLRDATARERYADLKRRLEGEVDGRAYTAAKLPLLQELLDAERARRGLPPASAWDK